MAYEVEAIVPDTPPTPNSAQPIWRAERVVDYKQDRPRPKSTQLPIDSKSSEVPAEPKGNSEAPELALTPAAAALARKEQAFRKQQAELKAKQEALEAERKEIADLKALKAKLAAKDFSEVEKFVSYDDYTNYLIEKGAQTTPEQEELKKLRSELTEIKTEHQKDIDKRFEAAVAERRKAVTELVNKDSNFSSIKEMGAAEHVVQHILDTWEEDGIELSVEDAAKEVEEALVEKAQKWAGISKLKPKEPPPEEKKTLPPMRPAIKTITNTMAATGEIKPPKRSYANMSDIERYQAARRAVEEKARQGN